MELTPLEESLLNDAIAEATHEFVKNVPDSINHKEAETRFSGAVWYDLIKTKKVICGGCGGIMSNFIFQLARISPESIIVYDPDKVEMVNMAGQMFKYADIGAYKTQAALNSIQDYSNYHSLTYLTEKYDENSIVGNIMICGFDNMVARSVFFNNWLNHVNSLKEEDRAECLFIDGRLSFDTIHIFCITGDDDYHIKDYKNNHLFSDLEADNTVCSLKQTTFMANMIASYMVNAFINFCANEIDSFITSMPYFIEYNSDLMQLKVC